MNSPAVFKSRAIWYESSPSVLTVAQKCAAAKDAVGNPRPLDLIYLPLRQSKAAGSPHETTAAEIQQVRQTGAKVGPYAEVRWFPVGNSTWTDTNGHPICDPIVFRQAVSKELLDLYKVGDPIMFDWEKMPSDWLKAFLLGLPGRPQGWRGKDGIDNGMGTNPGRPFAWTDASWQAGNYSDEILMLLDKFGAVLFLQLYYGMPNMAPVVEREDAIRELRDRGFPGIDVYPMYDADAARQPGPNNWRIGCLFTSNRWLYLFQP